MRPGQNKRMRGRNNNRKGPNPLTRNFESNGPDVKIRGTAQHVGEKYLQLARDANSSGDRVMAESYLQHAEHYFRLIAAAQQVQQQQSNQNRQNNQPADNHSASSDANFDDDLAGSGMNDRFAAPAERAQAMLNQPQPTFPSQGNPFDNGQSKSGNSNPAQGGQENGQPEGGGSEAGDRNPSRGRSARRSRNNDNRRGPRQQRTSQPDPSADDRNPPTLPAFITGSGGGSGEHGESAAASDSEGAAGADKPPRRRRQPKSSQGEKDSGDSKVPATE